MKKFLGSYITKINGEAVELLFETVAKNVMTDKDTTVQEELDQISEKCDKLVPIETLTQAEYEALSEDKKNNGTLYITTD